MGYSNSKSVSTYVFGITTNLYSVHGNIKVTQCQVGREEESACAHGRRGKGLMNQCSFDIPEGSAAAALHDGADLSCD